MLLSDQSRIQECKSELGQFSVGHCTVRYVNLVFESVIVKYI